MRARPHRLLSAGSALAALAVAVASCTPPSTVVGPVEIVTGFRVSPTFNAFTQPCAIAYRLEEPAWVQIRVVQVQRDGSRALVHQVTEERRETPGARTAAWRGTGPNGLFAPQGEYAVELYARLDGIADGEAWTLTTLMYRN